MPALVGARRVIIAVHPRLLADTLVRALSAPDLEVVLEPDAVSGSEYDLAVVMDDLPVGITAEVVIRLPVDTETEQGSVTTMGGTQPASVLDLADLLETLNRFLRPG